MDLDRRELLTQGAAGALALALPLDALAEYGPDTSVRCNGAVRVVLVTRCQVVYDNGDTQLLLVTLSDAGELDVQVPYPAQRRPGG